MPFYYKIGWIRDKKERSRIASNLIALRKHLKKEIPRRTVNDTLLLATWNIRDFDSNKFKHGPRIRESYLHLRQDQENYDWAAAIKMLAFLDITNQYLRTMNTMCTGNIWIQLN